MAPNEGQVITFYSYKGGTGRTFILANVAMLLACQGHRVCVLDFDLEAPGLHRYFRPFLEDPDLAYTDGLLDWLWSTANTALGATTTQHLDETQLRHHAISLVRPDWKIPRGGALELITAGRQDGDYGKKVNSFDWSSFYDRLGGGGHIERARQDLKDHYDYILVDSRTGVSDTSGVCTVSLPDRLVACYTLNRQSIFGVDDVLSRVRQQRADRPLLIFPLEARVETNEKLKLDASRAVARPRMSKYIDSGAGREYWDDMEVLYWPFYAFEECLSVFAEDPVTQTKLSMLDTMCRVANRVAGSGGHGPRVSPPEIPLAVRSAIMSEYSLDDAPRAPATAIESEAELDSIFQEAIAMCKMFDEHPGRRNLLSPRMLDDIAAAGGLPNSLKSNPAFMKYFVQSRNHIGTRRRLLLQVISVTFMVFAVSIVLPLYTKIGGVPSYISAALSVVFLAYLSWELRELPAMRPSIARRASHSYRDDSDGDQGSSVEE